MALPKVLKQIPSDKLLLSIGPLLEFIGFYITLYCLYIIFKKNVQCQYFNYPNKYNEKVERENWKQVMNVFY